MNQNKISIKANMEFKRKILKEIDKVLFKVVSNDYNKGLSKNVITNINNKLSAYRTKIENTIGTGYEDIKDISQDVLKELEQLKGLLTDESTTAVELQMENLDKTIKKFCLIGNGNYEYEDDDKNTIKYNKENKKYIDKIEENKMLVFNYNVKIGKLSEEIQNNSKIISEYNDKIIDADQMFLLEYVQKVKSYENSNNILQVRKDKLLQASSLITEINTGLLSLFSSGQYDRNSLSAMKIIFQINDASDNIGNLDQQLKILKVIYSNLQKEQEKIANINKVHNEISINGSGVGMQEALKYQEALRKQREEKIDNQETLRDLDAKINEIEKQEILENKNKGEL